MTIEQNANQTNKDDGNIDWTKTPNVPKPKDNNFRQFFQNTCPKEKEESSKQNIKRENLQRIINDEIEQLAKHLHTITLSDITNTGEFWNQQEISYPNLKQLAIILLGIPSSSAAVERFNIHEINYYYIIINLAYITLVYIYRFFSMCGFFSKKNASSIKSDLFKSKCMLRANLSIVERLENIRY